jgi:hypothetical protein
MSTYRVALKEIDEIKESISVFQRSQLPYVISRSLNILGSELRLLHQQEMEQVFDHKVSLTLRSPIYGVPRMGNNSAPGRPGSFYRPSNKADYPLRTYFELIDDSPKGQSPSRYLYPQTVGGPVYRTRFQSALSRAGILVGNEYAVPMHKAEATRRGPGGRMSTGQYVQAGWGVKALHPDGYIAQKYDKAKRPPNQSKYFVITRRHAAEQRRGLPPGIYMRVGGKPSRLFSIVGKTPEVRMKYDYEGLTAAHAENIYESSLTALLAQII